MAIFRSIHKINLSDRKDVFLISCYKPQKKLNATLVDLNKSEAFSGSANDIELRSQAANIRMSFSVFEDLTTKAFSQNEYDGLQFLYCLEDNCKDFVFKWKTVDSDETKITIGIIKMCKNDYATTLKNVFAVLAEELSVLNRKVLDIEIDRDNAMKEKSDAMQLVSKATTLAESIEKELYAKFVLVLNAKKRKIKDLVEDDSNDVDPKILKVSNKKPEKRSRRNNLHVMSDSSSDGVDGDLDDEVNKPGPSSKKFETSLMFDEDEPMILVSPSKVRNRKAPVITEAKDLSSGVKKTLRKICDSESEDDLLNEL